MVCNLITQTNVYKIKVYEQFQGLINKKTLMMDSNFASQSKSNLLGYFDSINIILKNRNKQFAGWRNRYIGFNKSTDDGTSASYLAEISVKSPRKLFIFIIYKNIFWIKVSKKTFNFNFEKSFTGWHSLQTGTGAIHRRTGAAGVKSFRPLHTLTLEIRSSGVPILKQARWTTFCRLVCSLLASTSSASFFKIK